MRDCVRTDAVEGGDGPYFRRPGGAGFLLG